MQRCPQVQQKYICPAGPATQGIDLRHLGHRLGVGGLGASHGALGCPILGGFLGFNTGISRMVYL